MASGAEVVTDASAAASRILESARLFSLVRLVVTTLGEGAKAAMCQHHRKAHQLCAGGTQPCRPQSAICMAARMHRFFSSLLWHPSRWWKHSSMYAF